MSIEIAVAHVQQFRADFIELAQQRESRLMRTVRDDPDSLDGKAGHFDRIGAVEMTERVSRHQDTEITDTPFSRRRIVMRDFDVADLIDPPDIVRMLTNPASSMMRNMIRAANRKKDDRIIRAAVGNSTAVDEDDAATSVALPATQIVTAGGTGLTLAKVLSAREILNAADNDPEEPAYAIHSAKQLTNMLNTTEVKSADFNSVKALVNGEINSFLGFEWIRSERLTLNTSSERECLFYTQSALGVAIGPGEDTFVDVGPRRDKRGSIQVLVRLTMDATRIEEEKLVKVDCVET